jgi:hypothetical protein
MRRAIAIAILLVGPALGFAAEQGRPDTGKAESGAVFGHRAHLSNAPRCTACHQGGDLSIVPDLDRCAECHNKGYAAAVRVPEPTTHGGYWYRDHPASARAADAACAYCHDQPFCEDCHRAGFADRQGKVNIHRSDFRVTHPIRARAGNGKSCAACHENGFCSDCHRSFQDADLAFLSHRKGWSAIPGGGSAHESFAPGSCLSCHSEGTVIGEGEWTSAHAREARRALPACQSCHADGQVCLKCHSAREGLVVNPHPKNWDDMKGALNKASGGKTCRRCH